MLRKLIFEDRVVQKFLLDTLAKKQSYTEKRDTLMMNISGLKQLFYERFLEFKKIHPNETDFTLNCLRVDLIQTLFPVGEEVSFIKLILQMQINK
jgi:hypothetical protein